MALPRIYQRPMVRPIPLVDIRRRRDANRTIATPVFADGVEAVEFPIAFDGRGSPWSCSVLFLDCARSVEDRSDLCPWAG